MTSTTITDPVKDWGKFPKLMEYDNNDGSGSYVILVISNCVGIVLTDTNRNWHMGEYLDDLAMEDFADFHGTVQLRNE